MKKFRLIALLLIFALIATMVIGCSGSTSNEGESEGEGEGEGEGEAKDEVFISIATGGTAGAYYPIGGAMASVITNLSLIHIFSNLSLDYSSFTFHLVLSFYINRNAYLHCFIHRYWL